MKLCIVGDVQSIHVQRFASYFADNGYDVHVVTLAPGEFKSGSTHYIGPYKAPQRFDTKSIKQLLEIRKKTRRIVSKIKPDIVHAHYIQDSGFFAAMTGFHPFVVTSWGSDILIYLYRNRLFRIMTLYVLKRTDAIHSVSNNITEKIVELGIDKKKVVTVPMGVDLSKFNNEIKPMIGDKNVVVSTRNLKPVYDVKSLIVAVPDILRKVRKAKIIIAGNGEERESLKALAEKSRLTKNIEFLGPVRHEDIPRLLNAAEVYVSTSLSDGTSTSLLEAMACGTFPVVTNIPANRDWIKDGENGFLVPTNSPKELARKVVEALGNSELRESARVLNIQLVRDKADWKGNMKEIEELYRRLLKGEYK